MLKQTKKKKDYIIKYIIIFFRSFQPYCVVFLSRLVVMETDVCGAALMEEHLTDKILETKSYSY